MILWPPGLGKVGYADFKEPYVVFCLPIKGAYDTNEGRGGEVAMADDKKVAKRCPNCGSVLKDALIRKEGSCPQGCSQPHYNGGRCPLRCNDISLVGGFPAKVPFYVVTTQVGEGE